MLLKTGQDHGVERTIEAPALLLLGVIYAVSRAGFYLAGVRFDLEPLSTSWQVLDPVLLRHALLTSVFHMPGQPPLYNLMLGAVLKTGYNNVGLTVVFRLLYSSLALITVGALYVLLRRLAVARWLGLLIAVVFMLSPALVLYEAIPYYTLPVVALLTVIGLLFHRCVERFTMARGLALFAVMAVLIYTRSLFQVEWFIVLAVFLAVALPGRRRQVLIAAALPLVLILALYAKNAAIIGSFSTSDWLGMSLSKLTTMRIEPAERQSMIEAGTLTPMAALDRPFKPAQAYLPYIDPGPTTGVAVLDTKNKSTGHVNFNYRGYAAVSRAATANALAVIRTRPTVYLRAVGIAWLMFLRPSADYPFLQANRSTIRPWARLYGWVIAGQPHYPDKPGFRLHTNNIGWLIGAGYALAVIFGLMVITRCVIRRRMGPAEATLIFIWLNVMYVSVIGNALEIDENQRFRFAVNPFIGVLLGAFAQRLWLAWRKPGAR